MTLEEAISHLNDLLESNKFPCLECKREHVELRNWLIELKELREKYEEMRSEI